MKVFDETDETLVRYLLNELSKAENEEIEDEMVLDPEFSERVQAVETSLIESYLLSEMSAAKRTRFVKGYFLLPENLDKVEDARAFHEALRMRRRERQVEPPPTPMTEPAQLSWFASLLRMPAPAMAFAALVLIAAVVAGIYLFGRLRSNEVVSGNHNGQENVRQQVVSSPEVNRDDNSNQRIPVEKTNAPTNNATTRSLSSNQEIAQVNAAPPGRVAVSIVENNGRVGTTRGAGGEVKVQTLRVPAGAKVFTMRVSLEPREYFKDTLNCSVDISNVKFARLHPGGDYKRVKAKPVAGRFQVSLDIPTALLKEGEIYYFRVDEIDSLTPFSITFTK
ncbi:MAG: hypothetical protein QOH49_3566 [Acidobacteriota bacterium]|jgi:hypothetical protein|nr:hypothetical protein [Acidobacteriota bacterium]